MYNLKLTAEQAATLQVLLNIAAGDTTIQERVNDLLEQQEIEIGLPTSQVLQGALDAICDIEEE